MKPSPATHIDFHAATPSPIVLNAPERIGPRLVRAVARRHERTNGLRQVVNSCMLPPATHRRAFGLALWRWSSMLLALALSPLALSLAISTARAQTREPADEAAAKTAIDNGLAFLARDAVKWKAEYNCSSCHHAALVVWSMNEAKRRHHTVDETVFADMTRWLTEAGEGKTSLKRPAQAPKALNAKAVYYALGLGSASDRSAPQQEALDLLLRTVREDQTENGSWASWPETRPPIFGNSDETMTALATLALWPAATAGNAPAQAALDKGIAWLEKTETDGDPQSIALRLVLWTRLDRPRDEWIPLARRIRDRQREDGGWSQTEDGASDAWATGQALYALAQSKLPESAGAIDRGRAFLLKSQREDGSWPMVSRPQTPGGEGSDNLIPVIGAGSAWAVLGLVHTASE